jgi:hypothetical protein
LERIQKHGDRNHVFGWDSDPPIQSVLSIEDQMGTQNRKLVIPSTISDALKQFNIVFDTHIMCEHDNPNQLFAVVCRPCPLFHQYGPNFRLLGERVFVGGGAL